MRGAIAGTLALALACYALPSAAQQPAPKPDPGVTREDASKVGPGSVTGSVKTATDKGLVVMGHEQGQKDKEWAFALDGNTRIDAGGKTRSATELRAGDTVTVSYRNRDGKIVAQNIKVKAQ
jgi:uncharacterized protein DUF5666